MAPESFSRVEQVYHAALAHPAEEREAFLERECGGDEFVLREVRSLLGYEEEAKRLLEEPVPETATQRLAVARGTRLGPYEVVDLLGAGGMGEVYRARDSRLDRDVAVKVLPEHVAHDPEALGRFTQEAKALAALSHPHICALYDVGREEGVDFAVMELLEGETLRERLNRGALSPEKTVDLAVQLCHGLAAAHAKGLVHRDLKPENLFLTREGVKIVDFGLAKRTARLHGEETSPRTQSGMLLGTVGYLSPEQARGEPADARSDVFALGAVLYEMLSGRRAFKKDTPAETLAAILKEEPPELASASGGLPPALERIVHRCLEKGPGERFQSAHDLALALEATSGASSSIRPRVLPAGWWGCMATGLVLVVALAAGLWLNLSREPPKPLRVRPLTSDPGPEWSPALSPDGNQVAFVKPHEGRLALFVKQVDGGEPLLVSQGDGHSFGPGWSPDGLQIAFSRYVEGEDGEVLNGIFVVPALGGTARRLTTCRQDNRTLSWSPDQEYLAIADKESPDEPVSIFLLSPESGQRRRVTTPPAGYWGDYQPRYSPNGRMLAFVRAETQWVEDIYVIEVEGGEERRLTVGNDDMRGLDWAADGRSIIFSAFRRGGVSAWSLWRVPLSGGPPERLEFGDHGFMPTVSRRGGRLAYEKEEKTADIWRVGGPASSENERAPTRLISSTHLDYHPEYSPDGQHIAFVSGRSGAGEIWISDADGSNARQLTFLDDPSLLAPAWSPDGQRIAFFCPQEGSFDVYVVSVSGGFVTRLTTDPAVDGAPSWSRDGEWIYFRSNRTGSSDVWKVPAGGGDPIQVTTDGGTGSMESPDGRFLYFGKGGPSDRIPGLWRMPVEGGDPELVLDRALGAWWAVIEEGVLYVDRDSTPATLELFDLEDRTTSRVAELGLRPGAPGISVSPDRRWVLYARSEGTEESDIILVENFE